MKTSFRTGLLVVLAALFFSGCKEENPRVKGVEHVILIGLDGWGSYSMPAAEMPAVKQLMTEGSYTFEARSILPTSSACNWASMFMGAGPELHGFTTWGSQKPDLPSRELTHYGLFPTVIGLLRDQRPETEIGYIFEWGGMKYLCEEKAVNHFRHTPIQEGSSEATVTEAENYILEKKPGLLMVVFDEPDATGHQIGHDTPDYYTKLAVLDGYVSRIVEAAKKAGIYEKTVFIVTSDHGGINKGHGGKNIREQQIPLIISGKGVRTGYKIGSSVMIYDIAATIARIYGLERPQVWTGRPVEEIFE